MRENSVQFKLRIPKDVHAFIVEEAERNNRTRNNQMVTWFKEKMNDHKKEEA